MVLRSSRRSFLQPTRIMGRPWQKCRTSEIHYRMSAYSVHFTPKHFLCFGGRRHPPSPGRCRANRGSPQRNRSESHVSRGMREDGDGHNLPGQQYPKGRAQRACYQPRHRRRSSRRLWGRRPGGNKVRLSIMNYAFLRIFLGIEMWFRGSELRVWIRAYLGEGALGENTVNFSQTAEPKQWKKEVGGSALNEGATFNTHMSRQVLPQAPSPTMTSLRRISAILIRNESV